MHHLLMIVVGPFDEAFMKCLPASKRESRQNIEHGTPERLPISGFMSVFYVTLLKAGLKIKANKIVAIRFCFVVPH